MLEGAPVSELDNTFILLISVRQYFHDVERKWSMGFTCSFVSYYTFINAMLCEYLCFIHNASSLLFEGEKFKCLKSPIPQTGISCSGQRIDNLEGFGGTSHSETTLKNLQTLHSRKIDILNFYYFLRRQRDKYVIDKKKITVSLGLNPICSCMEQSPR